MSMSATDEVPWIKSHIELYKVNPEQAHYFIIPGTDGKPRQSLLLTTIGAKSGQKRDITLFYAKSGDNFVLAASLGGAPVHPAWYKNLVANPTAEIQVGLNHYVVKARDAKGEERKAMLQLLVDQVMDRYNEYEEMTQGHREMPIVVLEPQK